VECETGKHRGRQTAYRRHDVTMTSGGARLSCIVARVIEIMMSALRVVVSSLFSWMSVCNTRYSYTMYILYTQAWA